MPFSHIYTLSSSTLSVCIGQSQSAAIQICLGYEHVTFGAVGLITVSLLKDLYYIPHMEVYKVNPEVDPNLPLPPSPSASIYQAYPCPCRPREGDLVLSLSMNPYPASTQVLFPTCVGSSDGPSATLPPDLSHSPVM